MLVAVWILKFTKRHGLVAELVRLGGERIGLPRIDLGLLAQNIWEVGDFASLESGGLLKIRVDTLQEFVSKR